MSSFDQVLPSIIKSLKSSYGDDFFKSLVIQLNLATGADYTFIAKVDQQHKISRTLALTHNSDIINNIEYSFQGTPCADVANNTVCIYPNNVCDVFPKDQLLVDMNIEGYAGVPLHDSSGAVIGILVGLFEEEIVDSPFVLQLLELFSGRISAEIERSHKEKLLLNFNKTLEKTIRERTEELTATLDHLMFTQEKMVEQEKMASLGNLVAGVAHEINTPLGIAVLSASNIEDTAHNVKDKVANGGLRKSDLLNSLDMILESSKGLAVNLQRSAELVCSFKQVAVELNIDDLKDISLHSWLETLISSLKPMLVKKNVAIELSHPDNTIKFTSYASLLSQVLVNLVTNCAMHAFENSCADKKRLVSIYYQMLNNTLEISIKDNGEGISSDILPHIFEPFYTTKRGKGGTGLGLSIVINIIKGRLEGEVDVKSEESEGTEFLISLPALSREF